MTENAKPIRMLAGVPGMPELRVDDGRAAYPDTTVDMVKVLRSMGLEPQFDDPRDERRYIALRAFELWLPIMQVAHEVLVSTNAGLLVDILKGYLGDKSPEDGLLHVDWRVETSRGHVEKFEANGRGSQVVEALGVFERRVREL